MVQGGTPERRWAWERGMTIRRLIAVVLFLGLAAWIAAIFGASLAAGAVFSTLGDLDVTLSEASILDAGDQGRYIAGFITQPIFAVTDALQTGCAIIVLAMLAIQLARSLSGKKWQLAAMIAACVAAALLLVRILFLTRPFDAALAAARRAVADGDLDAYVAQAAIMHAIHPTLVLIVASTLLAVIVALIAAAASTELGGATS